MKKLQVTLKNLREKRNALEKNFKNAQNKLKALPLKNRLIKSNSYKNHKARLNTLKLNINNVNRVLRQKENLYHNYNTKTRHHPLRYELLR